MDKDLQEIWKIREFFQKLPLIGGKSSKEEGNGYHNQICFYERHLIRNNDPEEPKNLLYKRYFDSLYQALIYAKYNSSKGLFNLRDCSDEYIKTFNLYIGLERRSYSANDLPLFYLKMASALVNYGRGVFEFVSWRENESDIFYGFELKEIIGDLSLNNHIEQKLKYQDHEGVINKVEIKIPKEKCIVVEWPKELGGWNSFYEIEQFAFNIKDTYNQSFDFSNPKKRMEDQFNSEALFFKTVSKWGALTAFDKSNDFYKIYCILKFKQTVGFILKEIQNGFVQVVNLLNVELNEKAIIEFNFPSDRFKKSKEICDLWSNGKIVFDEVKEYIHPYD